jgi:RNA polymerase sigma-70 factor, ECF subfamily
LSAVEHSTEQDLAARIRAGDKSACAECIELHAPAVYRLAFNMLGDAAEAEDVTQETFLNAFAAIDRFEWRSGLGTWLHRIAYNQVLMRLRKRQPLFVPIDAPEDDEQVQTPRQLFDWCCLPDKDFETAEAQAELRAAILEMPEKLREVFVLRELEGLSTENAAAVLDLSVSNVKVRLHRGRLWLRERLAGYFTELAGQGELDEGDRNG